jgi:hypothetical protein
MDVTEQILAELEMAGLEARCIGCGCTNLDACADDGPLSVGGRCVWVAAMENGKGLCSRCAAMPVDKLIEQMQLTALVSSPAVQAAAAGNGAPERRGRR